MTTRFLLIAFGWSWTVGAIVWATGGLGGVLHVIGGFAFMLGPAIAALWVTPRGTRTELFALKPRFDVWLLAAWALPAVLLIASTLGAVLVPGTRLIAPAEAVAAYLEPEQAAKLTAVPGGLISAGFVFQALFTGPLFNVPVMLSEELGWRGALWSAWRPMGFWRQALATGPVWGVWHAPMILMGHNYPEQPVLGVLLMMLFCTLLTPLLHHVRDRGGTVWHACLFHGTINAGSTLAVVCLQSPSWVGKGLLGVPGFLTLAVGCAVVAWARRRAG